MLEEFKGLLLGEVHLLEFVVLLNDLLDALFNFGKIVGGKLLVAHVDIVIETILKGRTNTEMTTIGKFKGSSQNVST